MAGEKLLEMMNSQGGKDSNYSDILYGTVISSSPLSVQVSPEMTLPAAVLEVGRFGQTRKIAISGLSVTTSTGTYAVTGNATISEGLNVGDKVALVRGHGGNRFYITDKV
ncbi:MAG: DUF2577 domain-containing protein [Streptococcaceae bacterium]|jgi:hypothetical protein|nr:DUF2577 domain-containing protein [Streptococcaceae bacterium]